MSVDVLGHHGVPCRVALLRRDLRGLQNCSQQASLLVYKSFSHKDCSVAVVMENHPMALALDANLTTHEGRSVCACS